MAREDERRERSVRVFTVNNESRYVLVRNIPALGVIDDLLKRLSLYGKVCEYRILDHADDRDDDDGGGSDDDESARDRYNAAADDDRFTDVVWVQYETVNNARHAKVRATQKPFFGSMLHISYAPQHETREDTARKLQQRRELLQRRARMPASGQHYDRPVDPLQLQQPQTNQATEQQKPAVGSNEFIGPQLQARDWRPPEEREPSVSAQPHDAKTKRRRI